jgi:putative peptidoglycan lipid II flippase
MGNETNDSSTGGIKRRLAVAAAFLVVATAGSRVLGLVREIIMSSYIGLGTDMGMYTVANKVPSLVRTLLADTALSAAFIPVFSGLLEKGRRRDAWQVAFTVTLVATVVLGVITILGVIFSPQVVKVIAPGKDYQSAEIVAQTAGLMRIMFPTVVILGIAGIFMGILNSYNHFALPAIAPIAWNLVIIGVVIALTNGYGVKALAWGTLAGTVVELIIQVPAVWKRRWRPGGDGASAGADADVGAGGAVAVPEPTPWRLTLRNPEVRRVAMLLGPVILSLGVINFNAFIDTIFATLIHTDPEGAAPGWIERAFRLFQLPQGVFAIAIGTVLFPALSRHATAKRMKEFREDLSFGLRQIFFVTLPFAALFAVLSVPTVRLIYEYGKVQGDEVAISAVGTALLFFSIGMAFVSVNTLLNRAFYSIQKPSLPLVMGAVNLALNAGLDALLYKPLGVGGITLSTSIVSLINFFGLMALLGPRIGGVDARGVALSAGRSIAALVPLAGVAYGVWYGLDAALGHAEWWARIISVCVAYAAGGLAYCLAAWAMRMPELRDVVRIIRKRREPRATEEVIETETGV